MGARWHRVEHAAAHHGHALEARVHGTKWRAWALPDGTWTLVDTLDPQRVFVVGSFPEARKHAENGGARQANPQDIHMRRRNQEHAQAANPDVTITPLRGASDITVSQAMQALSKLDPSSPVIIGIADDEYSDEGGIFVSAQQVDGSTGSEGYAQFTAWVDILPGVIDPNPSMKRRTHKGAKKRKGNTHDPERSSRHFEAAIDRADRELTAAAEALHRGSKEQSAPRLVEAAYWLGRARSEESYARVVRPEARARLNELETSMKTWGKTLVSA